MDSIPPPDLCVQLPLWDNTPEKQCAKCKAWFPATPEYFFRRNQIRSGLDSYCKPCYKILKPYSKKKAYYQEYHQENKEHRNQQTSTLGKAKRAERRLYHKSWRDKNPEKARLVGTRRKARIRESVPTLTGDQWNKALAHFGNKCAVCGRIESDTHFLAMDHWYPLSKGGSTSADNIIPLCHSRPGASGGCNNDKHNTEPQEWLLKRYGEEGMEIYNQIRKYLKGLSDA